MNAVFDNPEEMLLRAVRDDENAQLYWANGRPTSAAFKIIRRTDPDGLSVDRAGNRKIPEAVKFMKDSGRKGRICGITVGHCREKNIFLQANPLPDNEWHCLLRQSLEKPKLSPAQATHLALNAKLLD